MSNIYLKELVDERIGTLKRMKSDLESERVKIYERVEFARERYVGIKSSRGVVEKAKISSALAVELLDRIDRDYEYFKSCLEEGETRLDNVDQKLVDYDKEIVQLESLLKG